MVISLLRIFIGDPSHLTFGVEFRLERVKGTDLHIVYSRTLLYKGGLYRRPRLLDTKAKERKSWRERLPRMFKCSSSEGVSKRDTVVAVGVEVLR
jgi:hypothetical protein